MEVVVDTNIIYSGIFFGGLPLQLLDLILDGSKNLVLSEHIIAEYKDVVLRHIQKRGANEAFCPITFLESLIELSILIEAHHVQTPFCADPNDIKFLQAAIASKTEYLVSGDRDLLDVKCYPGGRVVTVREFLYTVH